MRRHVLVIAGLLGLIASSALADDGAQPDLNNNPPPAHDRLASVPMECMMPPLPSLLLDNASTPGDLIKTGARMASDFIQDAAIYMNCVAFKAWRIATIVSQRIIEAIRAKMNGMQSRKNPAS